MSLHSIEVVQIGDVTPHPNADRLELTNLWGWQCCVGKGQFKPGDKAVYVPPDYVVPSNQPEFAFLKRDGRDVERITVRRFRGTLSQGLLIPLPARLANRIVGDNVIADLGIMRYEAPLQKCTSGEFIKAPDVPYAPKFDVDSFQRYHRIFDAGEQVVVTEKIHGANARYTWAKDQNTGECVQFCGSRTNWMKEDEKNVWWMVLRRCPAIGKWCQANHGKIMYGEAFGRVQSLKYGAGKNDIFFAAFAVLDHNKWVDYADMVRSLREHSVPLVPHVFTGPLDLQAVYEMAESDSRWPGANHLAEGVVVVPAKERFDERIGRVCLKIVSNRYLEAGTL